MRSRTAIIAIVATIARIARMITEKGVWTIMLKGILCAAPMPSQEPVLPGTHWAVPRRQAGPGHAAPSTVQYSIV